MNPYDFLLDPGFESYRHERVQKLKSEYLQLIERLDVSSSYRNIFYNLWHSTSPCFDVQVPILPPFYEQLFNKKVQVFGTTFL